MVMGEVADGFKLCLRRLGDTDCFEDNGSELAAVLVQDSLREPRYRERGICESTHRPHPAHLVARGGADIPILPAMIAPGRDAIAPRHGAHDARAGGCRVRAVLTETYHFGRRNELDKKFCQFEPRVP